MKIKFWGGSSLPMYGNFVPDLHLEIDGEHWVVMDGPKLVRLGDVQEISVPLTVAEIELLDSALDSFEYWEHRDQLPHDSGNITVEDDQDYEAQVTLGGRLDEDEMESADEAWEAVKDARALARKLFEART